MKRTLKLKSISHQQTHNSISHLTYLTIRFNTNQPPRQPLFLSVFTWASFCSRARHFTTLVVGHPCKQPLLAHQHEAFLNYHRWLRLWRLLLL